MPSQASLDVFLLPSQVDLARTFTGYDLDLCLCDVDTVWINGERSWLQLPGKDFRLVQNCWVTKCCVPRTCQLGWTCLP